MSDDVAAIAVIGMAGRFPGASDLDLLWRNLAGGVDSITRPPASETPYGVLAGADEFDAGFFDCSPLEALLLEPQQRVFLECAWEALEDAGHDPAAFDGTIGVYAGSSETPYADALRARPDLLAFASVWQIRLATGIDFLTTRAAYKLGLRGPAVTVQTACSTSLVAIHLAAQALLAGDCDMALAGGVSVRLRPPLPAETETSVVAADGRCRAFDAAAQGTVFASGAGVVVLRRLAGALAGGDRIRAVVRGSAVSNDGMGKVGFTAPGLEGQARAVREAHLVAGVDPATITYVEAHGTGTAMGDPIEVAALTRAFREGTDRRGYCALGSVKTNIGHTDAAAGVAGFIKTVLSLERRALPPSLHFETPNPEIDFEDSPFFVNRELRRWEPESTVPRRAGVSALGIGGTNAHVVLEEAPDTGPPAAAAPVQLLVLSARSAAALDAGRVRLGGHLREHQDAPLADVAWTLQVGRRAHAHRAFTVCSSRPDAIRSLAGQVGALHAGRREGPARPVVMMFPGQGGQHPGMGRELYEHDAGFRQVVDECCRLAVPALGFDLRDVLLGDAGSGAEKRLDQLAIGQPAVFVIEYALARLWQRWGVVPAGVVGHSLGAYAAACLAGVLSLPDAIQLVVARGQLLGSVADGAMLAVPLPEAALARRLQDDDLAVSAVNGPAQCVVSGSEGAVEALRRRLAAGGVETRRLHIGVAAHSHRVEPMLEEFEASLRSVTLRPPVLPFLSDMTGAWTGDELTRPAYWCQHLRRTVRFGDAVGTLFQGPESVLLEVGPGQALTALVRRRPDRHPATTVLSSLPHPGGEEPELATVLTAAGHLWLAGTNLRWPEMHAGARRRASLPATAFERQRYAVEPPWGAGTDPLPGPPPTGGESTRGRGGHEPAAGGVEARLARLFALVLGLDRVHADESLFALGGDSLVAAQLVRSIRDELRVDVPVRAVFRNPTPAGLASLIGETVLEELQGGARS